MQTSNAGFLTWSNTTCRGKCTCDWPLHFPIERWGTEWELIFSHLCTSQYRQLCSEQIWCITSLPCNKKEVGPSIPYKMICGKVPSWELQGYSPMVWWAGTTSAQKSNVHKDLQIQFISSALNELPLHSSAIMLTFQIQFPGNIPYFSQQSWSSTF